MSAVLPHDAPVPAWRVVVATALAYTFVGLLALQLALPPGFASPLYPSAGIALAATLVHGAPGALGAALGAFATNLTLSALRGQVELDAFVVPLAIGLGAGAQAAVGAALVRRLVAQPLQLAEPGDLARFGLLGGAAACLISASSAMVVLVATGAVPAAGAFESGWTWWVGDTLGVLIGAPIALAVIGRPAEVWRARRRTVALPLLLVTVFLSTASLAVGRWDEERLQARFHQDAEALLAEVQSRLREPQQALRAMQGVWLAEGAISEAGLREASRWWLAQPMALQAIGYSVRVPRAGLADFEQTARQAGTAGYRVFERDAALAEGDSDVVAIRHIEPRAGNEAALGVNALSIAAAREAIERTRSSGEPAATAGFRLTQSRDDETGVVLYQALYERGEGRSGTVDAFHGVLFVTVNADRSLRALQLAAASYLRWCLVDLQPGAPRPRLAGPAGCETEPKQRLEARRTLDFAGRQWELRIDARPESVSALRRPNAWLFSVAGLFAAAMLGALLLLMSGRTRRIELAVEARTAELSLEIGERRQAEAALRDSEARLRALLDHVPTGVIFFDSRGNILEVNPHLCAMTGYTAEQLRRMTGADVAHPDEREHNRTLLRELVTNGRDHVERRLRLLHADGHAFWARMQLRPLRGPDGRVVRLAGVFEDISEHLRLEESERARHSAEAASRMKSEFVSRMSHELRTPLNAMIGFAQLLGLDRSPPLPEHQREWASQIQRAGWHLLEMINETLDLARIESGALTLAPQPLALAPLIGSAVSMVAGAARERSVSIEVDVTPGAEGVSADETRLVQILVNLLSNAVKYNRERGSVGVLARRENGTVQIAVSDTGLGMDNRQLANLFQPYNRLGREGGPIEGTGIGLAISRRLAELMGGSLEASSTAGVGSVFTLRLPSATLPPAALEPAGESSPEGGGDYRRRLIHYVEDNEINVEVMRGILAQRPQVELSVSTLGLDALGAIREHPPDLILLDVQLPDISGLELLRHLKADDRTAGIPVMVISADATTARADEAMRLGALHYVTKPVPVGRFLALVDEVLEAIDTRWG